jgi:hypothetical protein
MELFLNLCWLSLLLPAYLLWRQRTASGRAAVRPLVFLGALGCAFILLFPVISVSDDLHAMRPEMEESERAFRGANRCLHTVHAPAHASQPVVLASVSVAPAFEQSGTVLAFLPPTLQIFSGPAASGRAPPLDPPASV